MLGQLEQQAMIRQAEREKAAAGRHTEKKYADKIALLKNRKDFLLRQLSEPVSSLAQSERLKEKFNQMKWIYGLFGTSLHVISPLSVELRLHASHCGVQLDVFHIILELVDGSFVVSDHDLPRFMPTDALKSALRGWSVVDFVTGVRAHLRAYVGRREEVTRARKLLQNVLVEDIVASEAVDLVRITVASIGKSAIGPITVTLRYDYLASQLPSKVHLEFEREMPIKEKGALSEDWKKALAKEPLSVAAEVLVKTLS